MLGHVADGPGEHGPFDVPIGGRDVLRGVRVIDPRHVLLDDRALVELGDDEMGRRPDHPLRPAASGTLTRMPRSQYGVSQSAGERRIEWRVEDAREKGGRVMVIETILGGFAVFFVVFLAGLVWSVGEECPHDDPRAGHVTRC